MYPRDHNPPHFHVIYGEFSAQVQISSGAILVVVCPAAQNDWSVNGWPHIDLIYFERGC